MFCQLWNTLSPQYLTRQIDPFLLLKQWSNLVPQYNVDYSTWWKTHLESSGTLSCSYLLSFLCNEIRRHLNFKRTTVQTVRTEIMIVHLNLQKCAFLKWIASDKLQYNSSLVARKSAAWQRFKMLSLAHENNRDKIRERRREISSQADQKEVCRSKDKAS